MQRKLGRFVVGSGLVMVLAVLGCDAGGESSDTSANGSGGSGAQGGGSSGVAGSAGTTSWADGDLVIDDFEDGDGTTLLSGFWYTYTDVDNGGGSTVTIPGAEGTAFTMTGKGNGSEKALSVEYSFDQAALTYDPYIGIGASLGSSASPRDLSSYRGIAYSYKGGAHQVRLETFDVVDYNYFGVTLPASAGWTRVVLAFADFHQEEWGERVAFDPANIGAISFHIRGRTGESNQLQVDDLGAVKTIATGAPDMELREPAPPTETVLPSIAIDNPLQERATRYLTRGYNITNWLEQERFDGFRYDEDYVAKLAAAGFKSLRLPIDLDRYIEATSGTGASLTVTVHEDLFEILDAFDTWTSAHGLSLTIDFHQYDKSLDMADPVSLDKAVAVWGAVAEHFADNQREDLFFELLNEPELSFGGMPPTQVQWTALAERMIAAIREHDTSHTIIFGDIEWYGIGPLSRRQQPLSDDNVIYAFHSYEPFIFTHQGASWSNMSTTHDLPYPYTKERWSQYFSDLGFTRFMEPWVLSSVRDYYRTGNRSHMYNLVATAKRWAVQHNVPVICNEFGAYDGTSRLDDRARYYTDIIDIFGELEVPWQQWFMIMDDEGTVIPEYRDAFELDQP